MKNVNQSRSLIFKFKMCYFIINSVIKLSILEWNGLYYSNINQALAVSVQHSFASNSHSKYSASHITKAFSKKKRLYIKIVILIYFQNVYTDTIFTMESVQSNVQLEHIWKKVENVLIVTIHVIDVMDQMITSVHLAGEMQTWSTPWAKHIVIPRISRVCSRIGCGIR